MHRNHNSIIKRLLNKSLIYLFFRSFGPSGTIGTEETLNLCNLSFRVFLSNFNNSIVKFFLHKPLDFFSFRFLQSFRYIGDRETFKPSFKSHSFLRSPGGKKQYLHNPLIYILLLIFLSLPVWSGGKNFERFFTLFSKFPPSQKTKNAEISDLQNILLSYFCVCLWFIVYYVTVCFLSSVWTENSLIRENKGS